MEPKKSNAYQTKQGQDTWTKAHENDIGILNIIKQRLKDIELQRWLSDVNNDVRKDANQKNKLRTFRKFKTIENYKCEDYLRQVTNVQHRITLTKLRLSNHKLAIETGRYVRPYKALSCVVLSCLVRERSICQTKRRLSRMIQQNPAGNSNSERKRKTVDTENNIPFPSLANHIVLDIKSLSQ